MSHSPERKEKNCLNCQAELVGFYCHVCGQENIEPKQSAWHLVTHFLNDITHFDGKFFTTLKDLLLRPGFLSKEFMAGRRAAYLHPVRMYMFTSAIFFLIFFSFYSEKKILVNDYSKKSYDSVLNMELITREALSHADNHQDSISIRNALAAVPVVPLHNREDTAKKPDAKNNIQVGLTIKETPYHSVQEYDSVQRALPASKRDGWLITILSHRQIELFLRYRENPDGFWKELMGILMHQFPKIFFISLPFFAFFLKLLYLRKKQYYYFDHGIFSIHLYIYSFIALLFFLFLSLLSEQSAWGWVAYLQWAIFFFSLWYFYRAMRVFYRQSVPVTVLKFVTLLFGSGLLIVFLFVVFFTYSVFEI